MTRCNSCNGLVTRNDLEECYICGDRLPGAKKRFWSGARKPKTKPAAPVTPLTNLLFIGSLVFTAVCFLCNEKMSLPLSAGLSGVLFAARILTERRMKRVNALVERNF